MRHALLAIAALVLMGCQPQSPDGAPAPPPADAPPAPPPPEEPPLPPKMFTGDLDARGTEPFWSLTVRADKITLTRPDPAKPVVVDNPGSTDDGAQAVWSTSYEGQPFIVTMAMEGPCSDGMSDASYPYFAVVTLGDLTFRGCANKLLKTSEPAK